MADRGCTATVNLCQVSAAATNNFHSIKTTNHVTHHTNQDGIEER